MSSFLQRGLDWLGDQQEREEAFEITYISQPNTASAAAVQLHAVPLRTQFTADEEHEIIHQHRWRDFRVRASRLPGGGPPLRGDRIEILMSDGLHIFEVAPPAGRDMPYLAFDPLQRWLRVHAREVDVI
jgi:hypothetical protein